MNTNPNKKSLENHMVSIIVVNPWDTSSTETTTGVYVAWAVMAGDLRRSLAEKHSINAFHVGSTAKTEAWVCPDTNLDCTLAQADSWITTDTSDSTKIQTDIKISIDNDDLWAPGVQYLYRDEDYSLIGPSAADDFTFELHFIRDDTLETIGGHSAPKNVGVNAGNLVHGAGSSNPYMDAVVWTVDSDVKAPLKYTQTFHDGFPSIVQIFDEKMFRVYADKGLGAALPPAWIWGKGQWVTVDTSSGTPVATPTRTTLYIGGGVDPTDSLWKATFFLRYQNPRSGEVDFFEKTGAGGSFRTQVCGIENPLTPYIDRDGYWKISHTYTVIFRPAADTGIHCYFETDYGDGTYDTDGGCTLVDGAKSRAMITITTTKTKILDLNIPSSKMDYITGEDAINPEYDPFHDFRSEEATATLSMQYCDHVSPTSGLWKWEKAPGSTGSTPDEWRGDWPITAQIGGFEWGRFKDRVSSAEIFASKITSSSSGTSHTLDFYARNIGAGQATGTKLAIEQWVDTTGQGNWDWDRKQTYDGGNQNGKDLKDGAWMNLNDDSSEDTLAGTYTYQTSTGNVFDAMSRRGSSMQVFDGLGGQGTQVVVGATTAALQLCNRWQVVAIPGNGVVQETTGNDKYAETAPCYLGAITSGRMDIGSSLLVRSTGSSPVTVTFDDGSTSRTSSVTSGAISRSDLKFTLTQADYMSRDILGVIVPVTLTRVDTSFSFTERLFFPVSYTYDLNPDYGVSKWSGTTSPGHDSQIGDSVAGAPGAYAPSQNSYMRRVVDLSRGTTANTTFWYWMDVQKTNDYLALEISADDQIWTTLKTFSHNITQSDTDAGKWIQLEQDLTSYVGGVRYLRLRFVSDASVSGSGVFVDEWRTSATSIDTAQAHFSDGTFDASNISIAGGTISKIATSGAYSASAGFTSFGKKYGWELEFVDFGWLGSLPNGTAALFQVRTAKTATDLLAASWEGPDGTSSTYYDCPCWISLGKVGLGGDTWLQYKVDLVSWDTSNTPSVTDVRWTYTVGFDARR